MTTSLAPLLLAGLEDEAPQVRRRRERVPRPHDHVAGVDPPLGVDLRRQPCVAMTPAMPASAQIVRSRSVAPMRVHHARAHQIALEIAHRAEVGVRQDRFAPGLVAHRGEPRRSRARSRRPMSPPGTARDPLRAVAHERAGQPVGRVDALDVVVDLGAEGSGRDRVVGIAGDLHRPTVLDRHEHGAGVGTVVRACGVNDPPNHMRTLQPGRAGGRERTPPAPRRRRRPPDRTRGCRPASDGPDRW